jgi:hypothetical protein
MTHHDNDRRNFDEAPAKRPDDDESPGWALPIGISAVALVAGILIFSTAGPDRTRTAQVNANPTASQPAETVIPKSNAPASESAPSMAPQKSNPAGTQ